MENKLKLIRDWITNNPKKLKSQSDKREVYNSINIWNDNDGPLCRKDAFSIFVYGKLKDVAKFSLIISCITEERPFYVSLYTKKTSHGDIEFLKINEFGKLGEREYEVMNVNGLYEILMAYLYGFISLDLTFEELYYQASLC